MLFICPLKYFLAAVLFENRWNLLNLLAYWNWGGGGKVSVFGYFELLGRLQLIEARPVKGTWGLLNGLWRSRMQDLMLESRLASYCSYASNVLPVIVSQLHIRLSANFQDILWHSSKLAVFICTPVTFSYITLRLVDWCVIFLWQFSICKAEYYSYRHVRKSCVGISRHFLRFCNSNILGNISRSPSQNSEHF